MFCSAAGFDGNGSHLKYGVEAVIEADSRCFAPIPVSCSYLESTLLLLKMTLDCKRASIQICYSELDKTSQTNASTGVVSMQSTDDKRTARDCSATTQFNPPSDSQTSKNKACIYRRLHKKVEHNRPPVPNQRKRENQHGSPYIHVPICWRLPCGLVRPAPSPIFPAQERSSAPVSTDEPAFSHVMTYAATPTPSDVHSLPGPLIMSPSFR